VLMWCREVWPQVLAPRRPPRVSFAGWNSEKQERIRLERNIGPVAESQGDTPAAPAPEISRPPTMPADVNLQTRQLRRSQRVRKQPQKYGQ
jgi:hypothetical protein